MPDEATRRWADAVVGCLGGSTARVAVSGSRRRISYTAVLAAHDSGAVLVPLNPCIPSVRARSMPSRALALRTEA